jgi:hypothetical protein
MRKQMRKLPCILWILPFLLATPAIAQPVRTFVSSSGNDTNPCTLSAPCRNFGAAINAVANGGEVVALDSAGYGPVTITKPVSVIAAPGIHAAIAPTTGTAIEVNAAASDVVVLRGLYLNSQGASYGIQFLNGDTLHVERCVINRFTFAGVAQSDLGVPQTGGIHLIVSDTLLSENGTGVFVVPTVNTVYSSLSGTRFESGIEGLSLFANARATCVDCSASHTHTGFRAQAGSGGRVELTLERCISSDNSFGVRADSTVGSGGGTSIVRVADSVIVNNTVSGIHASTDTGCTGCVEVLSRGNNTVEANANNGSFTGSLAPR